MELDIIGRISDTTGTLLAGNYADHNCRIGLILGNTENRFSFENNYCKPINVCKQFIFAIFSLTARSAKSYCSHHSHPRLCSRSCSRSSAVTF